MFRFETMNVWSNSRIVVNKLMRFSNELRNKRHFALSDQLFRASLSITNNIAEGSGSSSRKEFANFLNISRRSAYECVNILLHCNDLGLISNETLNGLKEELTVVSKQLNAFRNYQLSKLK